MDSLAPLAARMFMRGSMCRATHLAGERRAKNAHSHTELTEKPKISGSSYASYLFAKLYRFSWGVHTLHTYTSADDITLMEELISVSLCI